MWECPKPPSSEDELTGGKKIKRPDFTCSKINPFADTSECHEIPLHVECKLLGNPTSSSWILNENYVCDGIKRYDCRVHEYGKRASSGMMIGYIISMTPRNIQEEVNGFRERYIPSAEVLSFGFGDGVVHNTEHKIERQEVSPNAFKLTHLWVDLRSK